MVHVSAGVGDYDHDGQVGDDHRDTIFTFDAQGHQLTRTLPLGVSSFNPNATGVGELDAGRIPTGFTPQPFTEYFWYNDRRQQVYHVSFEGVVTQFQYDNGTGGTGRLEQKAFFEDLADYRILDSGRSQREPRRGNLDLHLRCVRP